MEAARVVQHMADLQGDVAGKDQTSCEVAAVQALAVNLVADRMECAAKELPECTRTARAEGVGCVEVAESTRESTGVVKLPAASAETEDQIATKELPEVAHSAET